jgi:hypothetical protein
MTSIYIVTRFERHVSEEAFPAQRIRNFVGNRLVEAHVPGNAQATDTVTLEPDVPSRYIRSCLGRGRQAQRNPQIGRESQMLA